MTTIENVIAKMEEQRRAMDEFKVAQATRLRIAEREIRALSILVLGSGLGTPCADLKRIKESAS